MVSRHWYGRRAAIAGLLFVAAGATPPVLAAQGDDGGVCQRAGLDAERKANLPPGVLRAIGLVESGRRDPVTGRVTAWPWTINVNGVGEVFENLTEALAETRALRSSGVTSVDVGCFQVNLRQHPTAFANLEDAFDPEANAAYAASFLLALRDRTGSWANAIAAYHSSTVERGVPYRDSVMTALEHANMATGAVAPSIERTIVWTTMLGTDRMQIWQPRAPGLAPAIISIPAPTDSTRTILPTIIGLPYVPPKASASTGDADR